MVNQGNEYCHGRFLRNIIVTSSKLQGRTGGYGDSYEIWNPPLHEPLGEQIDYNLFFNDTGHFIALVRTRQGNTLHYSLEQWQALEHDNHSLFSDPMFIETAKGDYRLKPESPAFKFGFNEIDTRRIGLLPDFPEQWGKS